MLLTSEDLTPCDSGYECRDLVTLRLCSKSTLSLEDGLDFPGVENGMAWSPHSWHQCPGLEGAPSSIPPYWILARPKGDDYAFFPLACNATRGMGVGEPQEHAGASYC